MNKAIKAKYADTDPSDEYSKRKDYIYLDEEGEEYFPLKNSKPPHY